MRTTVTLDDDLLAQAMEMTGIESRSKVLEEALRELVHREASRRLRALGGTIPNAKAAPRRQGPDHTYEYDPEYDDPNGRGGTATAA